MGNDARMVSSRRFAFVRFPGARPRVTTMHELYPLARPFLFALDAETAHDLAFAGARSARAASASRMRRACPNRPVSVMGITFPNRVGLAAGLDKNGAHLRSARDVRLRLPRSRHRDAARAAGQSTPAHVPPAQGERDHQPARLQQRRRRSARRQRRSERAIAASSASTSAATSTRRTSARPTTTSHACAPCTRMRTT